MVQGTDDEILAVICIKIFGWKSTICHVAVVPSQHFATICPLQKRVGSSAVPASCCAVHHEREKHQESSDTHPQNQPEPRASREKSKPLPFCLSLPL